MFQKSSFSIRAANGPTALRILFGGDFCPGPQGTQIVRKGLSGDLFKACSDFTSDADIRMAQFETPLTNKLAPIAKSGPALSADPISVDLLAGTFNVALLANNHTGDQGDAAVIETISLLEAKGLATTGAGKNLEEASRPLRITVNGKTVSIVNACEHEFGTADKNHPGANPIDIFRLRRVIAEEKQSGATVITVLHGGHEFFPFPSPRVRDLCRELADAGSSAVFNCHPHCPQGIECHNGVPIVYCPGNLFFPRRPGQTEDTRTTLWRFGYMAKVCFDSDGPFAIDLLPYSFTEEKVIPLPEPQRSEFISYIEKLSATIQDTDLLQLYFDAWCTESGISYFGGNIQSVPQNWKAQLKDHEGVKSFLGFRNLFTCEAHNDLIRNTLLLAERGELDTASDLLPHIHALQNPAFALPNVPELLRAENGMKITDAATWESVRRPELLDVFTREEFGKRTVERPANLHFEEIEPDTKAMNGKAVRRKIRICYEGPGGQGSFDLLAFIPVSAKPVPAYLLLNNRDPVENTDPDRVRKSDFWPAEDIVDRGYAALTFHVGSVVPDNANGYMGYLQSLFESAPTSGRPDSWATISAWAWCGSRVIDWIETEPRIDAAHVAVIGHSRGGKTALWCGATDQRVAMAVSSCSGCAGAKLNRYRQVGAETINNINQGFPFWFCPKYHAYAHRELDMPFDQHELIALCAPRLAYVSSASRDSWAGQPGEFHAARLASPAWELYGKKGIVADTDYPPLETPIADGCVGYHVHKDIHTITRTDWAKYMDFTDSHGWRN